MELEERKQRALEEEKAARVRALGGRRARLLLWLIAFTCPIAQVSVSDAEEEIKPRLWVAPTSHDGSAVARFSSRKFDQEFRKRLSTSRRLEMVQRDQGTSIAAGEPDPRVIKAELYKHSGIEALRAENHDEAWRLLKASLELFKGGVASIKVMDSVFQAYAFQIQSALRREYDEDAKVLARQLVAVMPAETELPSELSSKVKRLLKRERRRMKRKRPGSIEVKTNPPGAEIFVDGRSVCPASPCTVGGLIRGDHFLQAKHPEAGIAGSIVSVKGGWSREAALTLQKTLILDASKPVPPVLQSELATESGAGRLGQKFRAAAEAIAVHQEADFVLSPVIAGDGGRLFITAFLYNASSKQTIAFKESRFSQNLSAVKMQAFNLIPKVEEALHSFPADQSLDEEFKPLVLLLSQATVAKAPVAVPAPVVPTPIAAAPPPRTLIQQTPPPEQAPVTSASSRLDSPEPSAQGDRWYQKWWVWTSVGGVVVTGAIVAGILALDSDDEGTVKTYSSEVLW